MSQLSQNIQEGDSVIFISPDQPPTIERIKFIYMGCIGLDVDPDCEITEGEGSFDLVTGKHLNRKYSESCYLIDCSPKRLEETRQDYFDSMYKPTQPEIKNETPFNFPKLSWLAIGVLILSLVLIGIFK